MRRLLIFVLLGIITYSTFSSFIPEWPEPETTILLDIVYGVVEAGNFSYWNFAQKGPLALTVELTSNSGDADLFVSDVRPSFEADRNNFSSETCGIDTVYIPADFPRPIIIAVFGHWAHAWSEFSMKVFTDLAKNAAVPRAERQASAAQPRMVQEKDKSRTNSAKVLEKDASRFSSALRREDESRPRYLQLFRVLDTMIGLFV